MIETIRKNIPSCHPLPAVIVIRDERGKPKRNQYHEHPEQRAVCFESRANVSSAEIARVTVLAA